jgi:hypothetical protein
MNLDEHQKKLIAEWLEEGLKLSEIQNRLASDLGIKLTYMEVRFLVDDLKLTPKQEASEPAGLPQPSPESTQPAKNSVAGAQDATDTSLNKGKGVSVTVDTLMKPGTLVSGKVTFSDGNTADWYLDQMGQVGMLPKTEGYRPSAADVREFQVALEREITRAGL